LTRTELVALLGEWERLRRTSKDAFGREFMIETCLAIRFLEETFLFDDVFEALSSASREAGAPEPSASVVRKDLQRLRETFRATRRLPPTKGERLRRETRLETPLWSLCERLAER
jgi:hypothetical protein